jgi:hypothetical protein
VRTLPDGTQFRGFRGADRYLQSQDMDAVMLDPFGLLLARTVSNSRSQGTSLVR